MGDMSGGAVSGGDKVGHTVALARGGRGGLMETVSITGGGGGTVGGGTVGDGTVEHVRRFLSLNGGQPNPDRVSNELQ